MQIEMRIHYIDGHQDIMLHLNFDCFPYFNYESLESLHAEFNQDHIPYLQKYMHNGLQRNPCHCRIAYSLIIRIMRNLWSHCVFMINTCSAFFCGILVTTASVFVIYSRYFHTVRFSSESLSWSQCVFLL